MIRSRHKILFDLVQGSSMMPSERLIPTPEVLMDMVRAYVREGYITNRELAARAGLHHNTLVGLTSDPEWEPNVSTLRKITNAINSHVVEVQTQVEEIQSYLRVHRVPTVKVAEVAKLPPHLLEGMREPDWMPKPGLLEQIREAVEAMKGEPLHDGKDKTKT